MVAQFDNSRLTKVAIDDLLSIAFPAALNLCVCYLK